MDEDTQTARVTLTLNNDYNSIVLANKSAFIAHIKSELAIQMDVDEERLINFQVSQGR